MRYLAPYTRATLRGIRRRRGPNSTCTTEPRSEHAYAYAASPLYNQRIFYLLYTYLIYLLCSPLQVIV